jgi:tetratricopeptide (TPR) repeat protein
MFSPFLVLATGLAFQQIQPVSTPPAQPAAAPRPAVTPEMRCDIMMARKLFRDAVDCFKVNADKSAVWANKTGIAYHQMGDPEDLDSAGRYYRKAIKLNPQYAEAINNLGTIYYAKKSYRRAITQYRKALELEPGSAPFLANLGTAYFARKQYQLASEEYVAALKIDPDIFERRSSEGSTIQDQNVEERAKYHYYVAKTYAQTGEKERAIQYIRKALEEGFKDRQKFLKDPEFASLQNDPEFKEVMATEQKVL